MLERVAKVWRDNREAVLEQGADTIRQLQEFTEPQGVHLQRRVHRRLVSRVAMMVQGSARMLRGMDAFRDRACVHSEA